MIDIAPELLAKLQEAFKAKFRASSKVKKLNELISAGKANYRDANEFAIEIGEILARVYQENLSGSNLPDGKMYYNIAQRVIEPTLKQNYELTSAYSADVQQALNKQAGISLKAQKPAFNQDRVDGIVNRLAEAEQFDDVKWILAEPVVNFTQAVVDAAIKVNADFQSKVGLSPMIIRTSSGDCCDWCDAVAGKYRYPDDVPKDVFRRHRFCRCECDYIPSKGKANNVWTKKVSGSDEDKAVRKKQYERWENEQKVVGLKIGNTRISKISKHCQDRMEQRAVSTADIVDAIKHPLEVGKIKIDSAGRSSFTVIGAKSTISINPETGVVTTVHKTHSKLIEKIEGSNK